MNAVKRTFLAIFCSVVWLPISVQAEHSVEILEEQARCSFIRNTGDFSDFVFESGLRSQKVVINQDGELVKAVCTTGEITSDVPLFWSQDLITNPNCVANGGNVACVCRVNDAAGHELEVSFWEQKTNPGGAILTCYGPDSGTFPP
jgi:hypothetical protein